MTETLYSLCCRGSMNEKSAKCFQGGGWLLSTRDADCPHCHKPMFCTAELTVVSLKATVAP